MFAHPYIIGAVCGVGFILGMMMPLAGLTVLAGYLMLLMIMIKTSGIDVFLSPLGKREILNLFITKAGKIIPEIVREDEGYARRRDWGIFKIVTRTKLIMCNKPTILTTEGVPYSIQASDAQLAMLLVQSGIKTKEDLEAFLNVKVHTKREVQDVKKPERKTAERKPKEEPEIPGI